MLQINTSAKLLPGLNGDGILFFFQLGVGWVIQKGLFDKKRQPIVQSVIQPAIQPVVEAKKGNEVATE